MKNTDMTDLSISDQADTIADRELRKLGIDVYQGDQAHKEAWERIVKDERTASMIRTLCYDKKKKEQSVILIAPDNQSIGSYRFGYRAFQVNVNRSVYSKTPNLETVFAKRVPRDKAADLVREEDEAPAKKLLAEEARYRKELKRQKISRGFDIFLFSLSALFFVFFLCTTFLLTMFGFEGMRFKDILVDNIGEHVLESLALIFAIASCNFIGYLAFYDVERISYRVKFRIVFPVYIALICTVLFFGWKLPLEKFYGNDVRLWIRSYMGIFWIAAVVFSAISVAGFFVLQKLNISEKLYSIYYVLITLLFPIVVLVLCLLVAGKLLGKFDEFTDRGGSSGSSSRTTYEFTNSMGCTTTVESDNGRDFYDPCTGSHVGTSSDGGQTITED